MLGQIESLKAVRMSSPEPQKIYISYNNIHKLCQKGAKQIIGMGERPDLIIGISGGGLIPARIIRSCLKREGERSIPIQTIGLSLYEDFGANGDVEKIGKTVTRTQWLDYNALKQHFNSLVGKKLLIVDECDDTRTTLHYAISELQREVEQQQQEAGNKEDVGTTFTVFVLHNKLKPKKASLPASIIDTNHYIVGKDVPDEWLCYPWDADDIEEHTRLAELQGNI